MNKDIMNAIGFEEEVKLVEKGFCPFCKKPVDTLLFKDQKSIKEYRQSGLCQKCQDEFYDD